MAEVYRGRVAGLQARWRDDAVEAIRTLVEKVVLVPVEGKLAIDGEIGSTLKLAMTKRGRGVLSPVPEQLVMVAGACNQLDLQLQGLLTACCETAD